jgi:hypothetical protein
LAEIGIFRFLFVVTKIGNEDHGTALPEKGVQPYIISFLSNRFSYGL